MAMTGRKIRESEPWKHRRKPAPIETTAPAIAAIPAPIETRAERVLIDRWVASRLVPWPPSHCFGCKLPIVVGAKWVELVCDDNRARFHSDCEPVWRAEQEVAARRSLWGQDVTGGILDGAQK
jgi:hypothetical protein